MPNFVIRVLLRLKSYCYLPFGNPGGNSTSQKSNILKKMLETISKTFKIQPNSLDKM